MASVNTDIIIRARDQASAVYARLGKGMSGLTDKAKRMGAEFRGLDRIWTLMAVGSGVALTTAFFKMAASLELTELRLAAFTKSLPKARVEMQQILDIARNSPLSFDALTKAAVRLKAAGLDPLDGTLGTLSDTIAAFGGNDDLLERSAIAIQQMAGKGVISMEELRQQLGEAIPSALQAMAEGANMSVQELVKKVSTGGAEFQQFFQGMIKILERDFGGLGALLQLTFTGQIQRAKTEFQAFADVVLNKSGALNVFTALLYNLNEAAKEFSNSLAEGKGIEKFREFILDLMLKMYELWPLIKSIGAAIWSLGEIVLNIIGAFPPEMAAGGIIGYMFFGKLGMVAGALLGLAHSEASGLLGFLASMVRAAVEIMDMIPGGRNALAYGMLGYFIFGWKAGILLAMGSIIWAVRRDLGEMVADTIAAFYAMFIYIGNMLKSAINGDMLFNGVGAANDAAIAKMKAGGKELMDYLREQNAKLWGEEPPGPNTDEDAIGIPTWMAKLLQTEQMLKRSRKAIENTGTPNAPDSSNALTAKDILDRAAAWEQLLKKINDFESSATLLEMENNFDKVGIAGEQARQKIQSSLDGISVAIADVNKKVEKGLLSPEQGDEAVARLEDTYRRMEAAGAEYIERMKFLASDWGQLVGSIGASMEQGFANAFEQIANGTANAKDLLLAFYADITRAVSQYLARQAMVAMFGNMFMGGGAGGLFGAGMSLFGGSGGTAMASSSVGGAPINTTLGSFQHGGSFMVGGHGGPDSQLVAFRASPDERVTVTRPDQEGGGGGSTHITINAMDARSVRDLFMREGSALTKSLGRQQRLNRI